MRSLILDMLKEGFTSYHNHVAQGPVTQCIHAAHHTTAPWFHLHTFCDGGTLDRMHLNSPSKGIYWCHRMHELGEVEALTSDVMNWAAEMYGPLRIDAPKSC